MRNFLLFLVVVLIVAGGYAYNKNPKACQKLGLDIANDTTAIFTPSDSMKAALDKATAPAVEVVSPPVTPSAPVPTQTTQVAPQPDPMAGNVLSNGDFSKGDSQWHGDGATDPQVGKALIVSLNSDSWTSVAQDFKGDKGTSDTVTINYRVSSDLSASSKGDDYTDILKKIRFEGYEGFGPVDLPPGDFLVWIGDLTNHSARYERWPVKPDSGESQTIQHTFPASAALADKMITVSFPPGTGKVYITSISVTSK